MSVKKRLFGTFGVRRTANDVLTPEFASRLAACYGTLIQGKVAVGGDTRTTSPMLMEAVKAGLLSSGCDVVELGTLPTPAVQFAVRNYYDGGIIITASHNPPKYNGIKFLDEEKKYIVILEEKPNGSIVFWTAYPIDYNHKVEKLKKQFYRYIHNGGLPYNVIIK